MASPRKADRVSPEQSPHRLADAGLLMASVVCIVIVVIILSPDQSGQFIGPW